MKKFKIVSNVMMIIAIASFTVSMLVTAVASDKTEADIAFLALIQANALLFSLAFIGTFLIFTKNETAQKTGNGFLVAAFMFSLIYALCVIVPSEEAPIGAIIMIIAAAFLALHYAFAIAGIVSCKTNATENPDEDIKIVRVKQWKQLAEEKIISEEEFQEKRMQILGIKPPKSTK